MVLWSHRLDLWPQSPRRNTRHSTGPCQRSISGSTPDSWLHLLHRFSYFQFNCSGHSYLFPCGLGVFDRQRKLQPCCNLRLNDLMPKTLSWMMAQQLGHFTGICESLLSALSRLRIVSQSRVQQKLLVLLVVGLFTVGSQTPGHWPPVCLHLFMLEKYQHTRRNRAKGSNSGATEKPRPRRVAGAPGNSVVSRFMVKMPAPERRRRSKPASPG